jgi:hypothetical protein
MSEIGYVSSYGAESAAEMRAALKKAIALKPDYAGSYSLLAFVNMVTGEQIDESIELLKNALKLAPGEERFRLELAQLYLRKQDFEAVRKIVEPLAQNSPDPQIKGSAASLLKTITNFQEQEARFKAARASAEAGGGVSGDGPPRPSNQGEVRSDDSRTDATGLTPEEAIARAIREAMRKPEAGELRARGVLTRIECDAKGTTFHVRVGEQVLKLFGGNMSGIHFMAFTQQEAGGEITCGVRKPESQVVVTYRVRGKGGDLVAVEFVPANFTLEK